MATAPARSAPRTRASLACQSCRRRKVKCDAQTTPTGLKCTNCQQMNIPCAVNGNGDRRKSGSRKHVEALEKRIQSLEGLLRQQPLQNGQQSEIAWDDEDMNARSEDGSPVEELMTASTQSSSVPTTQSGLRTDQDPTQPESQEYEAPSASYSLSQFQNAPLPVEFDVAESLLALDNGTPGASVYDDPHETSPQAPPPPRAETSASSSNKSNMQNPGALGPTSQYHLQLSGTQLQPPCTEPDDLADFGISVDINSAQVKSRLLQSFFRYQTLWVSVVDEELFYEHQKSGEPSMWYSTFLETVMLACAARLSTSSAVRSLGERYSTQAKVNTLQALESPSAASMQGFMLLSEYEVTHGRDRIGWQLCGMACRLLPDLGLHESLDSLKHSESIHIKNARLHLLGACVAFEGVWCMYLGRPSSISRSILQRTTSSCEKYQGPDAPTLAAWLGLCGPMADICDILNSQPFLHAEAKARLLQLNDDLRRWLGSLPPGFGCDETNTADLDPTAYGVHMQYCKVQILVQQAFCPDQAARTHRVLQVEQALPCNDHEPENAQQLIYDAAIRIVCLLLTYRQIHGAEKIPSVMLDNTNLALTTLISHYLQNPDLIETQKRDVQWLRLAIESIITIWPHFPIIGRMLGSLKVTVEGTPLAPLFRTAEPLLSPEFSSMHVERSEKHCDHERSTMQMTGRQNTFDQTSLLSARTEHDKYSPPAINTIGVVRILRNEPMLTCQQPEHDPEQLSASLLCWPNPQNDLVLGP